MSPKRVPIIPDLATTGEQGLPGVEASVWNAFFLPKGTPDPIVRRLTQALNETLESPSVRERFEAIGEAVVPSERRGPQYFTKFVASEIERWAKPIKASGVTVD